MSSTPPPPSRAPPEEEAEEMDFDDVEILEDDEGDTPAPAIEMLVGFTVPPPPEEPEAPDTLPPPPPEPEPIQERVPISAQDRQTLSDISKEVETDPAKIDALFDSWRMPSAPPPPPPPAPEPAKQEEEEEDPEEAAFYARISIPAKPPSSNE